MKTSKTVIEPCFDDFIKPVSFPTNPTKQGYEFVGWYMDEGLSQVFNGEAYPMNETNVTGEYDKTTVMTDAP